MAAALGFPALAPVEVAPEAAVRFNAAEKAVIVRPEPGGTPGSVKMEASNPIRPAIRARLSGAYRGDARYPSATVNVTNHCNLTCRQSQNGVEGKGQKLMMQDCRHSEHDTPEHGPPGTNQEAE